MISKAQQKRREQEVHGYVSTWAPRLLLDSWDVFPSVCEGDKSETSLADITCNTRYHEAHMSAYPLLWESPVDYDRDYREGTIVHELAHVVVAPLADVTEKLLAGKLVTADQFNDALEQVTEHIAKALVRAYR